MEKVVVIVEVDRFQIDRSGQIRKTVLMQWMEVARFQLVQQVGLLGSELWDKYGVEPARMTTEIKQERALTVTDRVRIEASVSRLAASALWTQYEFFNVNEERVAIGRSEDVFLYRNCLRPYCLSEEEQARLAQFV